MPTHIRTITGTPIINIARIIDSVCVISIVNPLNVTDGINPDSLKQHLSFSGVLQILLYN